MNFDDDDFEYIDDDYYQHDNSQPRQTQNDSFQKGKEFGEKLGQKIKDGSLKEDVSNVKEDLKSGNIKDAIKDSTKGFQDKNILEKAGNNAKKTGESMESLGKNMQKGNKAAEKISQGTKKAAKAAEKGGKAAEKSGKAVKAAGKAEEAAGKGTEAAGKGIDAAGTAAGAATYGVGKAVLGAIGKTVEGVGKAEQAIGKGTQATGYGIEAGGKGVQAGAKGVQAGASGAEASSKLGNKIGKALEDSGKKVKDFGKQLEDRGKEIGEVFKPIKITSHILKNWWKYVIGALVATFIIIVTISYNMGTGSISETMENFQSFLSGDDYTINRTSSIYSENGTEDKNTKKFYEEIEKWYNQSNGQIDFPLIFSILYYADNNSSNDFDFSNNTNTELDSDGNVIGDDADFADIDSLSSEEESAYSKGKRKRLRLLCKNMLNGSSIVSDEDYINFLKTKYVNKKPEFKEFYEGLTGEAKENAIMAIIQKMYEQRTWYTDVYGNMLKEGYVEEQIGTCAGGISSELINSESIQYPVDINKTPSFDGDTAYGIRNGETHNGVDLNNTTVGANEGDSVYAIADGEVISSEPSVACNTRIDANCTRTAGAWVRIRHNIVVNGTTYKFISVYMHLQTNSGQPEVGSHVTKGQVIGKVGNTGDSSGPHLHFEFRIDDSSTYGQAVDPTNLFIPCSSSDVLVGNTDAERIWYYFIDNGFTKAGTAGIMGNMYAESGLRPLAVQGDYLQSNVLEYDTDYTNKVDNGTISRYDFTRNGPGGGGYGLAQWTYFTRKEGLYDSAKSSNKSIGDLKVQLPYYKQELENNFPSVYQVVSTSNSVEDSSKIVLLVYENPADATSQIDTRLGYSNNIYNTYKDAQRPSTSVIQTGNKSILESAAEIKAYIANNGYVYGALGTTVANAVTASTIDCSSFVSWVLYNAGFTDFSGWQETSSSFNQNRWGFTEVSEVDMQPGDIVVYSGHVEIYAGVENGSRKAYNAGSDSIISNPGKTGLSTSEKTIIKVLRP